MTSAETGPSREERMRSALNAAFAPLQLDVVDQSAAHAGHAAAREGGQTHYAVRMVADSFEGQARIARHRAVTAALQSEFDSGLHALALELKAPSEV